MALSAPEAARQLAQCRNSESVRKDQLSSYWKQFGIDLSIVTYQDRDVQIGQKLARLNFLSRPLVMKKITGKLRPAVEAALSHVSQRPYLVGYSRQPFRDPKGEHSAARASGELLTSSVLWRCAYDQPIEWFAEWIGYLEEGTHHYGRMEYFLAAAIDAGNKVVLSTLLSSLDGTHPIGVTSGAGIRALLLAENPTGWNAVERLLLSAGRAEGLRQTIVECADELNPRAFRRVLRHIVEHDLLRFSSVARAYSLWFPGLATVPSTISANRVLSMVLEMLDDRSLEPDESFHQVYLRLWTDAFDDVQVAVKRATKLITSSSPEVRLAVTVACGELRHTLAGPVLKTALSDRDRNIVDHALIGILGYGETPELKKLFSKDLYRIALERKGTEASPLGLKSEQLWSLAARFSEKSELIAIAGSFSELPANTRSLLACLFDEIKDQKVRRQLALSCLADGQEFVRHRGAKELERDPYDDETFAILEKHLSKKGSSIRSEVLTLLAGQKGQGVLDCAARLSASDNENQKRGGEELYKLLAAKGQSVPGTPKVSDAGAPPRASRYNVFGLADPSQ
ncbi:MAG TPA: hypothetical protein VK171_11045, partial [Fimbriimonas sp.]|nr:hypothetical protein [Fimbriimonas sp.]